MADIINISFYRFFDRVSLVFIPFTSIVSLIDSVTARPGEPCGSCVNPRVGICYPRETTIFRNLFRNTHRDGENKIRTANTHMRRQTSTSESVNKAVYKAYICSIVTYGSETWTLRREVMMKIKGSNASIMMSVITGKTKQQEVSATTKTFDLVKWVRA